MTKRMRLRNLAGAEAILAGAEAVRALRPPSDQSRVAMVIRVLRSLCGDWSLLPILELLPAPERLELQSNLVDAAMIRAEVGESIPDPMQSWIEPIRAAWQAYAVGDTNQAAERLQQVGLRSPAIQWKLFLRGLLAWDQKDDLRAAENWGRLLPGTLPAQMARAIVDRMNPPPPAISAKTPSTMPDPLWPPDPLLVQLHSIERESLSKDLGFAPMLRLSEKLLPILNQHAPQLLPSFHKLCYAWLARSAMPSDLENHRKRLGAMPQDPNYHRLRMWIFEQIESLHLWAESCVLFVNSLPELTAFASENDRIAVQSYLWEQLHNRLFYLLDTMNPEDAKLLKPVLKLLKVRTTKEAIDISIANAIRIAPNRLQPYLCAIAWNQRSKHHAKAFELVLAALKAVKPTAELLLLAVRIADVVAPERSWEFAQQLSRICGLGSDQVFEIRKRLLQQLRRLLSQEDFQGVVTLANSQATASDWFQPSIAAGIAIAQESLGLEPTRPSRIPARLWDLFRIHELEVTQLNSPILKALQKAQRARKSLRWELDELDGYSQWLSQVELLDRDTAMYRRHLRNMTGLLRDYVRTHPLDLKGKPKGLWPAGGPNQLVRFLSLIADWNPPARAIEFLAVWLSFDANEPIWCQLLLLSARSRHRKPAMLPQYEALRRALNDASKNAPAEWVSWAVFRNFRIQQTLFNQLQDQSESKGQSRG
ncbi:hypothetical protein [Tuwongella immobilis]|uniref:hypothetical protein n=1 Tax=Tuwongella immobilis TaxID=692036 RepID=UPI001E3AAE70|nr:hypothetical protein [Tuwongella immobilis]